MGKLVIPAMVSILFLAVIGSSEDAFAVLKTCNGYTGLWTDAAAWSPAGQPATTDTLSITNCNLTIPASTDILIEEGLPPAGIDFLLQPAYAATVSSLEDVFINLGPEATLTWDTPSSDISAKNLEVVGSDVGELNINVFQAVFEGVDVNMPLGDVSVQLNQLNLENSTVPPIHARIVAATVQINGGTYQDTGIGGTRFNVTADRIDIGFWVVDFDDPESKVRLEFNTGFGPPSGMANSAVNLANGADGVVQSADPTGVPFTVDSSALNVGPGSNLDWRTGVDFIGNNATGDGGRQRFYHDVNFADNFDNGTKNVFNGTPIHGPTQASFDGNFDNIDGTLLFPPIAGGKGGQGTITDTLTDPSGQTTTVRGSLTVASGGTLNIDSNGVAKIRNGGTFTLDAGGTVNNDGRFVVQGTATASLSDEFNNNSGGQTDNWGSTSLECGGDFNNLGKLRGNPITDNCA